MSDQLPAIGEEVSARPALPPIGGEVGLARTPDFTATNEPPSMGLKAAAYGKDALQLALDALPGAGSVVGGVIATPETMGGGTLVGAALGAGAGRGLRDLIGAGLGLQKPSTAMAESRNIAMDAGETYVAGKVLPALWSAIKQPGATVADVFQQAKTLYKVAPKAVKAFLPDFDVLDTLPRGVGKAPASILERPAWQSWQEHLPADSAPTPPLARTTGTAWGVTPGASAARPVAPVASAPVAPAPVSVAPPVPGGPVAPASAPPPTVASAPIPAEPLPVNSLPDQKALNEAAIAARRATYQARLASAPPSAPATPATTKLTAAETKTFLDLTRRGLSGKDAMENILQQRELIARLGTPTPTGAQTKFPKGNRGKS